MPETGQGQPEREYQHPVDAGQVHKKSGLSGFFGGLFGHHDAAPAPMPEQPASSTDMARSDRISQPVPTVAEQDLPIAASVGSEVKPGDGEALDLSGMPVKPVTDRVGAEPEDEITTVAVESSDTPPDSHGVSVDGHEEGEPSMSPADGTEPSFNDLATQHVLNGGDEKPEVTTDQADAVEGNDNSDSADLVAGGNTEVSVSVAEGKPSDDAADFLKAAQASNRQEENEAQPVEAVPADTTGNDTMLTSEPAAPETPAADEAIRAEGVDTPTAAEVPAKPEAAAVGVGESKSQYMEDTPFPEPPAGESAVVENRGEAESAAMMDTESDKAPDTEPAHVEFPPAFDDALTTKHSEESEVDSSSQGIKLDITREVSEASHGESRPKAESLVPVVDFAAAKEKLTAIKQTTEELETWLNEVESKQKAI